VGAKPWACRRYWTPTFVAVGTEHQLPGGPRTRWTRATGYDDRWVDPGDDPREDGSAVVDERSLLIEYLRTQRLTLAMKCADLNADGLAARSVPPSTMSLLGLVRHMAEVERSWTRRVMAGDDAPRRYATDDDRDGDWNGAVADDAVVEEAWTAWREEQVFTDRFLASAPDLGITREVGDGRRISLREVLIHLIEEYARHDGHADLIRERVDGRVGQ